MAVFKSVYGEAAVDYLKRNLRNIRRAGHGWISHFYLTAQKIGLEGLDGNPNIHEIVTTHKYWEECREEARSIYQKCEEQH